jgi:hypothetical protein
VECHAKGAGVIEIPLSQGQVALIDDSDLALVSQYKWFADKRKTRAGFYASRSNMRNGIRTKLYMHRLIAGAADRGLDVDHKDGNGLHNWRSNLRITTRSLNNVNTKARNGSSKYKGVSLHLPSGGMWKAQARKDGKHIYIGIYKTEEEAAMAYDEMAVKLFGGFAVLNFSKGVINE